MRKFAAVMFALVMILAMAACGENEKNEIKLGTSDFSVTLPAGYEKTADDYDENQIAYYHKDDESIDFDVYQWDKEGGDTLGSEAEYFANEYGTQPESVEINGINCIKYVSEEEYDGYTYALVSYMFEDEESFIGLVFWTRDTDAERAAVEAIINTLKGN